MNILKAKVLDQTHLELNQPIPLVREGEYIHILITEQEPDRLIWNEISKEHLLKSYDDGDSIYDDL